jgi:hypothetical protein
VISIVNTTAKIVDLKYAAKAEVAQSENIRRSSRFTSHFTSDETQRSWQTTAIETHKRIHNAGGMFLIANEIKFSASVTGN